MSEILLCARQSDPPLPILIRFAAVLADARTAMEAVLNLVDPVWSRLGYVCACLWLPHPDAGNLLCVARWQTELADVSSSVNEWVDSRAGLQDLPGLAWVQSRVESLTRFIVCNGQSKPETRVYVPLNADGKVVGVLELIAEDASDPTADRLALLSKLGRRLGEFLHRMEV